MKTPSRRLPVLFVLLLAVSVALVGTATVGNAAAAVTKAQVKKIAAKVVKKAAPKLTVGNAAQLAGKPATAYESPGYRFRLPVSATIASRTWSFPLPAGNYLITYQVVATTSVANTGVSCALSTPTATGTEARDYGSPRGPGFVTTTASGSVIMAAASGSVSLTCATDTGTFAVNSDPATLSSISAVRIDAVTPGTVTTS